VIRVHRASLFESDRDHRVLLHFQMGRRWAMVMVNVLRSYQSVRSGNAVKVQNEQNIALWYSAPLSDSAGVESAMLKPQREHFEFPPVRGFRADGRQLNDLRVTHVCSLFSLPDAAFAVALSQAPFTSWLAVSATDLVSVGASFAAIFTHRKPNDFKPSLSHMATRLPATLPLQCFSGRTSIT
jgi:hypothetical protein